MTRNDLNRKENPMTNNTHAKVAREWAETNANAFTPTPMTLDQRNAIAAYILATTTPPTMADVEWDDDVHAGLCAEHPLYGEVRMIWEDAGDILFLYVEEGRLCYRWTDPANLTPIPGTKIDLTPLIPEEDWQNASDEHPKVLETEDDYRNAPAGTIVAVDNCLPRVKDDTGFWLYCGGSNGDANSVMAFHARRVLRWGESL